MHVGALIVLTCALVLAGWGALGLHWLWSARRDRTNQREWDELVRRHSDLDTELDQVWHST